jgi:hypothetical protein
MSNDKAEATWTPLLDPNKALDEIAQVLRLRAGDPAIANAISMTHIQNILAMTGRVVR